MEAPGESRDAVASLRAAGAGPGSPVAVAWAPDGVGLACEGTAVWLRGDGVTVRTPGAGRAAAAPDLVVGGRRAPAAGRRGAGALVVGRRRDPPARRGRVGRAPGHGVGRGPRVSRRSTCPAPASWTCSAGCPTGTARDDPVDAHDPVRPDGYLRPGWCRDRAAGPRGGGGLGPHRARGRRRPPGRPRGAARPAPGPARARPGRADRLVGVGRGGAGGRAGRDRAPPRPRDGAPPHRGARRPPARRRGRGGGDAADPGRRVRDLVPGRRGRRPAQPRTGAGAAAPRGHRRARHAVLAAGAPPRDAPGGRRAAAVAQGGAGRHDLRLRLARPARGCGRPAARAVDRLRRRRRADDRLRGAAQPAGRAPPGRGRRARARAGPRRPGAGGAPRPRRGVGRPGARRGHRRPGPLRAGREPAPLRPGHRQDRRPRGHVRPDLGHGGSGPRRAGARVPRRHGPPARRGRERPGGPGRADLRRSAGAHVAPGAARSTGRQPPAGASPATPSCRARRRSCSRCGPSRSGPPCRRARRSCSACTTSCSCTCPPAAADDVVALLHECLHRTAARWAAGSGVRLVADVSVVERWSDAKG